MCFERSRRLRSFQAGSMPRKTAGASSSPYQPIPKPSPFVSSFPSRACRLWTINECSDPYSRSASNTGDPEYASQRHTTLTFSRRGDDVALLVEHRDDAGGDRCRAPERSDYHEPPVAAVASTHHQPKADCDEEHCEEGGAEALAECSPVDERRGERHAARAPDHSGSFRRRSGSSSTSLTFAAVTAVATSAPVVSPRPNASIMERASAAQPAAAGNVRTQAIRICPLTPQRICARRPMP